MEENSWSVTLYFLKHFPVRFVKRILSPYLEKILLDIYVTMFNTKEVYSNQRKLATYWGKYRNKHR